MRILFLHRNFPAQFRHLAICLASQGHEVVYLTNRNDGINIPGIKKISYGLHRDVKPETHHYLKFTEDAILHGQGALREALKLKAAGFYPDVIIGHSWGPVSFTKDVFPKAKLIAYIEWFYNSHNSDIDFIKAPDIDTMARTRYKNSHILVDLYTCDKVITPTKWQLAQIPKEFHNKASVIHEGIDTEFFKPDDKVIFEFEGKKFTRNDEIIVYATRGMEPYRGFPQFMEAASIIQKRRPNAHIIIAGEDRVCYGAKLPEGQTFKKLMLEKFDYDESRLHFTGSLPYTEYVKLLQVSAVQVYLTYPFVLSWSMLEAMSCGSILLASSTVPVNEVIEDNFNGILFDFFKPEEIVNKVDEVLNNRDKYEYLRDCARHTIIENYNQKDMIKKQLRLLEEIIEIKHKIKSQVKKDSILIQTMIGEENVCARVRVSEPNKFLSTLPNIHTVEAVKTADLSIAGAYEKKVFIWQRIWANSVEQQKQLLDKNYLVIGEIDDDPLRWKELFEKDNFFGFRSCHGIQTSTEPLAEYLRKFNPNVKVFPNQLSYLPPKRIYDDKKTTLFFGALNREDDWKPIISSLNKIISSYEDKINVTIIHDKMFFDSLITENKEFTPYCPYTVYEKILRQSDIAILPLEFNRFNSMKSDLKFIECAGNGVAVLASPTVYEKTIENDKTGLIYNSIKEFEEKLVRLIEDVNFRREIVKNAYNYVAENRLLSMHCQKRVDWYIEMFHNLPKSNEELKTRAKELF